MFTFFFTLLVRASLEIYVKIELLILHYRAPYHRFISFHPFCAQRATDKKNTSFTRNLSTFLFPLLGWDPPAKIAPHAAAAAAAAMYGTSLKALKSKTPLATEHWTEDARNVINTFRDFFFFLLLFFHTLIA